MALKSEVRNGLILAPTTAVCTDTTSQREEPFLKWHVLWTRSNCEWSVSEQLSRKGYEVFLATVASFSKGVRRRRRVPMFSGYVFIRHAVNNYDYIDICNTWGAVSLLGSRWDRLACIADEEIETIRLATTDSLSCIPYPYLKQGDRVRIVSGALANVEGIFVRSEAERGLFLITVELLKRSIAVEIDCAQVVPA